MIDNSGQAIRLMTKLEATLPVFAPLSPELAAVVGQKSPALELPERCRVNRVGAGVRALRARAAPHPPRPTRS